MWRFFLALWFGKSIFIITQLLHIGGGSAAPGYYALMVCPEMVTYLIRQIPTNVVITGTNGKTTTARILTHFSKNEKIQVIRNATGSNLERGIASSLINSASFLGKIKGIDLGIWELDEAAFNAVSPKIQPQYIVFLNAFRDQLDRYGEVDSVVKKWEKTFTKLNKQTTLILNADDGNIAALQQAWHGPHVFFSIPKLEIKGEDHTQKRKLQESDFTISEFSTHGLDQTSFEINFSGQSLKGYFPIPGTYHLYDLLAAFTLGYHLHFSLDTMIGSLETFSPAFGRVEKININGKSGFICLIKNPTGATEVLKTITEDLKTDDRLFIVLNDNFADGTDISWIWDTDFEILKIQNVKCNIICSGSRAYDLALRLKYAGIPHDTIHVGINLSHAFHESKENLKGRLFILPTYTALLELQKILVQQKIKGHYWKENVN